MKEELLKFYNKNSHKEAHTRDIFFLLITQ